MSLTTNFCLYGCLLLLLHCNASVIDISHHFNVNRGRPCTETDIDAVYDIPHGLIWWQRCQTCRCVDGNKTCEGGPQCHIDYDVSLEHSCTQWSEDSCCCEHVGCMLGGVRRNFGEWYEMLGNPCISCLCSQGRGRTCRFSTDCVPEDIHLEESEIH